MKPHLLSIVLVNILVAGSLAQTPPPGSAGAGSDVSAWLAKDAQSKAITQAAEQAARVAANHAATADPAYAAYAEAAAKAHEAAEYAAGEQSVADTYKNLFAQQAAVQAAYINNLWMHGKNHAAADSVLSAENTRAGENAALSGQIQSQVTSASDAFQKYKSTALKIYNDLYTQAYALAYPAALAVYQTDTNAANAAQAAAFAAAAGPAIKDGWFREYQGKVYDTRLKSSGWAHLCLTVLHTNDTGILCQDQFSHQLLLVQNLPTAASLNIFSVLLTGSGSYQDPQGKTHRLPIYDYGHPCTLAGIPPAVLTGQKTFAPLAAPK